MASGIYNRFKANLMNKIVALGADVIKVMLLSNSHSFSATHNVIGDVNGNELAATGNYSTGGATLANKGVSLSVATQKWDADDVVWSSATFTAYHAVIWDDTIGTDDLICSIDFSGAKTVTAGTFTIQWNANGIITLAE